VTTHSRRAEPRPADAQTLAPTRTPREHGVGTRDRMSTIDAQGGSTLDALDVYEWLRHVVDPEKPNTLEQLEVVRPELITVCNGNVTYAPQPLVRPIVRTNPETNPETNSCC
jgi:hypothetical protein